MKNAVIGTLVVAGAGAIGAAAAGWPWSGSVATNTVTLLLTGDINIEQRADPTTAFDNVRETLEQADLVYGNLEGLLIPSAGPDKDIPDKSGWQHIGPEAVQALKAGNVAVVGIANNVAYGRSNIMQSLSVLDGNGIAHTGAGANLEDAHKPAIIERKGVKFGFLQYTAKWYQEDQQIATKDAPGVARIKSKDGITIDPGDLERMREDIRRLRPQVDVLIVSSHNRDGLGRVLNDAAPPERERQVDPATLVAPIPLGPQFSQTEPYQKQLAHAAIDAGADLVYGHGSHVVQGVEVYRGRAVMYCLGNFATDWIRMRPNREGLLARVAVENGKIAHVSFVPLTRDSGHNNVVMLDPAAGDGAKLVQKVKDLSGNVPLKIMGREVVLVQRADQHD